ncbi:hypothetical protein XPA_004373 [Xanthoria parietina]
MDTRTPMGVEQRKPGVGEVIYRSTCISPHSNILLLRQPRTRPSECVSIPRTHNDVGRNPRQKPIFPLVANASFHPCFLMVVFLHPRGIYMQQLDRSPLPYLFTQIDDVILKYK